MRKYITDSQELAVSPRRQGLFAMAAVAGFFMRFLAPSSNYEQKNMPLALFGSIRLYASE
jgi:hypothetical protein